MVEKLFSRELNPQKPNLTGIWRWLDSDYFPAGAEQVRALPKVSRASRWLPFVFLHLGALGILVVGFSPLALLVTVTLYWVRMFAVTAFYHRYFAHRTYKTSRVAQFVFAIMASSSAQRGPLWWAAHHRNHHRLSDKVGDLHSPTISGFIWSHIAWITADANMPTDYESISDLTKFPELVLLNRFDWIVPTMLGISLLLTGFVLEQYFPQLQTSALQLLVWGFFVSTVLLFHGTATINSLTHMFGSERYHTDDHSKNNFFLALITLGEGWHNNHHRFPGAVRQGFYWWEIDVTYYILRVMEKIGIVWDLRPVPVEAYGSALKIESGAGP